MTSFSVWPSPERPWSEVRALADFVDDGQWHCLWYADHFMPNTEDGSVADGDVHEVWSVLSAVGAVTTSIRIGSLVSPTTVRHPALLANTAATIDRITDGRLTLGLGAGWQINEHRAYGIPLLGNKDRVDRFEEACRIVRSLLTTDRTTFHGNHFSIDDAPCRPRPVQRPLPLMVGTGGPRMSRLTVELADEWNTWGTPVVAAEKAAVIDRACELAGRDPRSLRRSVQALFFLVDDVDTARRILEAAPTDRSVAGGPDVIAEAITRYVEAGFDEIIFPDFTLGADASQRLASYDRLNREVLDRFR
jgi:alkanesulfonate monooxygenase SsuD/methylene tetrahydromethanopterin reductase-like flavin-dependent oxidoreductase (luciferase family)